MHMLKDQRLVVLVTAAQLKSLKAEQAKTGASVAEIVRRAIDGRKK
jgi:hypothetical protein